MKKLNKIEQWLRSRKGSIVAFSGGIDSSLVLFLARRVQGKDKVIGVISNSESLKNADYELAVEFCKQFDITLKVVKTNEIEDESYVANPSNRCYFCKEHLYTALEGIKAEYPDFDILNGTNIDDFDDFRPGLQSARQHGVLSPMAEVGITKKDIRELALHFKLPNHDKPASPCLSSRIPYNHKVTVEKLAQIEKSETLLNQYGFKDVRVRHYGNTARIEVEKDNINRLLSLKDEIVRQIEAFGFEEVVIDMEGLVSGKLNREILNK